MALLYEKISRTCQPITNTIKVEYVPQIVTKTQRIYINVILVQQLISMICL